MGDAEAGEKKNEQKKTEKRGEERDSVNCGGRDEISHVPRLVLIVEGNWHVNRFAELEKLGVRR